ncbi:DUF2946 domain-containing protein [Marinobacterium mangrovicola]|uniref:DUF2946 domain-containing protein n=1 Tax=Marinobacterium mangrovicola TaxID=1476959 RepID=UPI001052DBBC|nr:DUF2946 domain-containing protein [Marinobacterium mangrovicola]
MFLRRRHLLRSSAWLALFALVLLLVAPLYSQLSRELVAPVSHHAGSVMPPMASDPALHHSVNSHGSHGAGQHRHSDWSQACGYCSLIQHFPFLDIAAPALGRSAIIPTALLITALCGGYASYIRFWHALKRAPPLNSPTLNHC